MTGGQVSFVRMLLDLFCRNMVSNLIHNIALTLYMSPMRRDIFGWGRIFNFTFPQSILLNPRPMGFQQITIWFNMTYLSTIMTNRNKLGITWLVKQEFSEQAASTITSLISTESNSESDLRIQQSNQACSKYLNEYTACFSNYHLRIFSRDFQIPFPSVSQ